MKKRQIVEEGASIFSAVALFKSLSGGNVVLKWNVSQKKRESEGASIFSAVALFKSVSGGDVALKGKVFFLQKK